MITVIKKQWLKVKWKKIKESKLERGEGVGIPLGQGVPAIMSGPRPLSGLIGSVGRSISV